MRLCTIYFISITILTNTTNELCGIYAEIDSNHFSRSSDIRTYPARRSIACFQGSSHPMRWMFIHRSCFSICYILPHFQQFSKHFITDTDEWWHHPSITYLQLNNTFQSELLNFNPQMKCTVKSSHVASYAHSSPGLSYCFILSPRKNSKKKLWRRRWWWRLVGGLLF